LRCRASTARSPRWPCPIPTIAGWTFVGGRRRHPPLFNLSLLNPSRFNQPWFNPPLFNPSLLNPSLLNPSRFNPSRFNQPRFNPPPGQQRRRRQPLGTTICSISQVSIFRRGARMPIRPG
jgi:hypothetical protein